MNGISSHRGVSFTMDQPVNISKASSTCNTFYVFLSAAKASLLPFFTLFFRLIGLSPFEAGIIMAAKTLTGFVWAPLWARCAVAYNKRRLVLVFSLLMMTVMYLAFIGVYYKVGNMHMCQEANATVGDMVENITRTYNESAVGGVGAVSVANTNGGFSPGIVVQPSGPSPGPDDVTNGGTPESADTSPGEAHPTQSQTGIVGSENDTKPTFQEPLSQTTVQTSSEVKSITSSQSINDSNSNREPESASTVDKSNSELSSRDEQVAHQTSQTAVDDLLQQLNTLVKSHGFSLDEVFLLSNSQLETLINTYGSDSGLTAGDIKQLREAYLRFKAGSGSQSDHTRHVRNVNFVLLNKLKESVGNLTATLEEQKLLLFLVVLLIVIFGEFFSSPVEKIADDAWFDFLERIDDMEKYGRQRYYGTFAFAIIPIVVGIAVDFSPCQLLLNLHHFLIHFYVFGVFMLLTIGVAFYFPMPPPVKQKYVSKVGKGLRLICCDCRGFLFVLTLLVAGTLYASFNNFLFWHLQDMGSQEVTMGLCVSIGAFAETPMLVFSGRLVRKLGNGWVVAMSLFVLALRLLFYGFVWTPWAVLPAEISNAFTHTALWYAVLSYDEFNQGSTMDRSIRSILSSFYFGLGFSVGSLLSGFVFHVYGAHVLYWGASVVSAAWCVIYSLCQLCLPKKEKVRYIKLLRKEEDESSDGEDDWLEMALKEQ